jgi:hypothetical protein
MAAATGFARPAKLEIVRFLGALWFAERLLCADRSFARRPLISAP